MYPDKLNTEQKQQEVILQMNAKMARLYSVALDKIDKAFKSGAIPEEWLSEGDHFLTWAILDSLFRDEGLCFSMISKQTVKNIKNLHMFL